MPIQRFYVPTSSPYKLYTETFTSSTVWTAPVGVTQVKCTIVGGGGGSGSITRTATDTGSAYYATGGGAGGEVKEEYIEVSPGAAYLVEIGAGGSGSIGNTASSSSVVLAGAGGVSTFALNYTLNNAVSNGSGEFGILDWRSGSSTNGFNSYPTSLTGYNSTALGTTSLQQTNVTTTSFSVTNVTENDLTRFIQASLSAAHNEIVQIVKVDPSTQYTLSAYANRVSGTNSMNAGIAISWLTSASSTTFISTSTSSSQSLTTDSVNLFTLTATSPSNATHAAVRLARWASTTSEYVRWTGIMLSPGSDINNYIGPFVEGPWEDSQYGMITISTGVLSNGGGGGGSLFNSTVLPSTGPGSGQARYSASAEVAGGHGAGAGVITDMYGMLNSVSTAAATGGWSLGSTFVSNSRFNIQSAYPTFSPSTSITMITPSINEGDKSRYGAGGAGGSSNQSSARVPFYNKDKRKNNGSGANGVALRLPSGSASMSVINGLLGKPGIVTIEYFGPAA
jgi:hypothetical protein